MGVEGFPKVEELIEGEAQRMQKLLPEEEERYRSAPEANSIRTV